MILWAGEASDFRIRRLNGMDIFENGASMSLLQVQGGPSQRDTPGD